MAARGGFFIVYNRIPAVIAAVEANSIAAVARKADDIVRDAQSRAPVRTGHLRGSIQRIIVKRGKEATIFASAEYAPYVEFGTYKMAARPFLYPAVMSHQNDFFWSIGPGAFRF